MVGCGCNNQTGGSYKKCACKKCRRYVQRGGWPWDSLFSDSSETVTQNALTQKLIPQETGVIPLPNRSPLDSRLASTPSVLAQGVVGQQGGKRKSRKTRKTRKTRRVKKSRKYRR
jgi:hypothetical protein